MRSKIIEIVAGPNGSGKSSFAQLLFRDKKDALEFINPDIIATGLALGREELATFRVGRIVITEVRETIKNGGSVAFESTLSGRTWLPVLRTAVKSGYSIRIFFLFLSNVKLNVQRIEKRVQLGGHAVPPQAVKRRYPRSLQNFWHLFRPLCTDWYLFDNSGSKPKLVLSATAWLKLSDAEKENFETLFLRKAGLRNGQRKTNPDA